MTEYATRDDLAIYGLGARILAGVSTTVQDAQLTAASRLADSYLRRQYELPISGWGEELTEAVCAIASYRIMVVLGYNPEGVDTNFKDRAQMAMNYLRDVSKGSAEVVAVDATPTVDEGGPLVLSDENRNW